MRKLTPKIKRVLTALTSRAGFEFRSITQKWWWTDPAPITKEGWCEVKYDGATTSPAWFGYWEGQDFFTQEFIQDLIEKGLVTVTINPEDKKILAITKEGIEALKEIRKGKGNKGGPRDRTIRHDRNVKGRKDFQIW